LIVLDASAVIELLLRTPAGVKIEAQTLGPEETLHVPHVLDLEVVEVLRRYVRSGAMTAVRGDQAVSDLLDLPLIRYPHEPFLNRIWQLRGNSTAYDAAYLALAESLPAQLLTCDPKLASTPGHKAHVIVCAS
jgi:predicted nucleic acid-binding protein